jgi:Fic family protein
VRKTPGEFRTSQNWIGGASISDAVFIPPAAEKLPELLSDFERFLNDDQISVPNLIKIAIAHYQFETIHPFLDGNGRIGRLLITLFLVSNNILDKPLLYLSAFFEKHRTLYYDNLMRAREKNDLAHWIRFFLVGVAETAEYGIETLHKIITLKECTEKKIHKLVRRADTGYMLLNALFSTPMISIKRVQEVTNLSVKAAGALVQAFVDFGILNEISEQRRNRIYAFSEYIELFAKE